MNKIARFEKVSYEQFKKDFTSCFSFFKDNIDNIYNDICLPRRATKGSAGYDFFSPIEFELKPGETIKVPTGIRVFIDSNYFLAIFPRSGLGFKYRLQLNNTVGIIDSDYYYSDNEGHVFVKITNDSNENKILNIKAGEGIVQGIFIPYGLADEEDVKNVRNGGFGSTTK